MPNEMPRMEYPPVQNKPAPTDVNKVKQGVPGSAGTPVKSAPQPIDASHENKVHQRTPLSGRQPLSRGVQNDQSTKSIAHESDQSLFQSNDHFSI
jgi:hypothetical protein